MSPTTTLDGWVTGLAAPSFGSPEPQRVAQTGRMAANSPVRSLDADRVWRQLAISRPSYPRVRLARAGALVPSYEYLAVDGPLFPGDPMSLEVSVDPAKARRIVTEQQGSLVWDRIEQFDEDLAIRSRQLGGACGCQINSSIYLTDGSTPGFVRHADWMDVIAQQVVGRKHWAVFRPDDSSTPALETVLCAGDALFVPAGWPHEVTPLDGPSLHVTTSAISPTVYDYCRAALRTHRRGDLPAPWGTDARTVADLTAVAAAALSSVDATEFLAGFAADRPVFVDPS